MTAISVPYLGTPPTMRALPSPRPGSTLGSPSMGDASSTSLAGVTSVFRNLYPRRTFSLNYSFSSSAEADLILNFYQGLYGLGPFVFVDSSARNMLDYDVASCGARSYASHGWVASSGALARTGTAPTAAPDSGVLTWSGMSASATLQPGLAAGVADPLTAPANLPLEYCTASLWAKAASGTAGVTLRLVGFDSAGVLVNSLSQAAVLTTTWQQVVVTGAPGVGALAGCAYVAPRLVATGTGTVSIAAAQLEYASAVSAWQSGFGSPRVVITSSPGRDAPLLSRSDHTLVLAE